MKILWFSHDGNMSGANYCLDEFITIMNFQNVENHLIVPYEGPMTNRVAQKIKSVESVKFYSWNWPVSSTPPISFKLRRIIRNRKAVRDIERIIRRINPDFVVTNTIVSPVAAIAAKRAGVKHIWFVHEFGEEDHGFNIGGSFTTAVKKMDELSYKMVFVSKALQKKYEPFVESSKMHIVYNAPDIVNPPATERIISGNIKAIMLGQIAQSKNQLEALKAIKICNSLGVKVILSIYGKCEDDNYMKSLVDYINKENLQKQVEFCGVTNNPGSVLHQHEVLFMCSRMEAFGRVTVEALKSGVAVIASNVGGSCEIIEDGVNGYLYEAGNANDMAEKINSYINNRSNFDKIEIAKAINERFNSQTTTQQLINVFA